MRASRIHHAAIICSDYPRSKHFYSVVLGLRVVSEVFRAERSSHKLDLALPDGAELELFSFPAPPPRPSYPEAWGSRHRSSSTKPTPRAAERDALALPEQRDAPAR